MNKLVIIGNGFDLAHGLPTSYSHFLNSFWENLKDNYEDELFKKLVHMDIICLDILNHSKKAKSFNDLKENLSKYLLNNSDVYGSLDSELKKREDRSIIFKFKNDFFRTINIKNSIENWVDIENEYYSQLKKIVKGKTLKSEKQKLTKKLNREFEDIKTLLKSYLQKNVVESFDFTCFHEDINSFHELFKINYDSDHGFIKANFNSEEDRDEFRSRAKSSEIGEGKERELLFLNFNYTPTLTKYLEKLSSMYHPELIHIHRKINDMVFGFGDETDEDYQLIEKLDDNEYLKNFKSFEYTSTSNYNNLFSFLDRDKFHIYIMGHSCGLSDKVLLNAIFEHNNCRAIKIFYHQRNGNDNFSDIVKNISRHFRNKALMRRKIIDKSLSEPLPQNMRFKNK